MDMHVALTDADIGKGVSHSCNLCPVALAVRRSLPPDALVHVAFDEMHARIGGGRFRAALPPDAVAFIDAFDAGRPTGPIAFDLTFTEED